MGEYEGNGLQAPGARRLASALESLPDAPGVYMMKGAEDVILYVGKALSLRRRVRSYFQSGGDHPPRTRALVRSIEDIDSIVTDTEMEALLLECTLIKRHLPHFNVKLKDDKKYPFLEVTLGDPFPAVRLTREAPRPGSRLFGPYTNVKALRRALDFITRMFKIRTCTAFDGARAARPCLDAQMDRCLAPCGGDVSQQEYRAQVRLACRFLEGQIEGVRAQLQQEMDREAQALNFERCIRIRNTIAALDRIIQRQKVVVAGAADEDFIALASDGEQRLVMVLQVREGKLLQDQHFFLEDRLGGSPAEALAEFIKLRYDEGLDIPARLNIDGAVPAPEMLAQLLTMRRGRKATIAFPARGVRREMLDMARRNAFHRLERHRAVLGRARMGDLEGMILLQEIFSLPVLPQRIEGYDVSNLQGGEAVGSQAVFSEGAPSRRDYRRYRIRLKETPDDYCMMREVLDRRLSSGARLPDLMLIDGGKGHLGAAMEVAGRHGLQELPIASLAKEKEEIFLRDGNEIRGPIVLPRGSAALQLLQRVRDEAHRFALSLHRNIREKRTRRSVLDALPGVGAVRKSQLIRYFGSPRKVLAASVEEIASVPGIGLSLANAVYRGLRGQTKGE